MAIFKVEGGHRLHGSVTPQGAKNEALQILCATLLTKERVVVHNVPQILDIIQLIELLGNNEIMRIKIGVGKKPHPQYDLADWVLSKFPKEAQPELDSALEKTVKALAEIISTSIDSAMNKFNN